MSAHVSQSREVRLGDRMAGKVVIVTGAGSGMGRFEAGLFAHHGARVIVSDRDASSGRTAAAEIGVAARFEPLDVTSEEDWDRVIRSCLDCEGRIDVLINNAGIFCRGTFQEVDAAALEMHFRVNVLGTFNGMKAVTPAMTANGRGAIVNVASGVASRGSGGILAYASSKWMVRGLGKCAAVDLGRTGIRVNTVLPGLIDTPMIAENSTETNVAIAAATPVGRLGTVEDVALAVLYLASDESAYLSGAEIAVDGGLFA